MPSQIFKDTDNKDSAMRFIFIPAAITIILLMGLIIALLLREVFSNGDSYEDLMGIFDKILLGGGGLFSAKVLQRLVEVFKRRPAKQETPPHTPTPIPAPVPEPKPTIPQPELPAEDKLMIIQDRIFENENKTLSMCEVWDGHQSIFSYVAIELPWRNNQVSVSRIYPGEYDCIATRKATPNPRTGLREYALWLPNVPGRTEIMSHIANYVRNLRGCIGPGKTFADLDKDGVIDVSHSGDTLKEIEKLFPIGTKFKYVIRDSFHLTGNTKPK